MQLKKKIGQNYVYIVVDETADAQEAYTLQIYL